MFVCCVVGTLHYPWRWQFVPTSGVKLLYSDSLEALKSEIRWRFYVFKDGEPLNGRWGTLFEGRQGVVRREVELCYVFQVICKKNSLDLCHLFPLCLNLSTCEFIFSLPKTRLALNSMFVFEVKLIFLCIYRNLPRLCGINHLICAPPSPPAMAPPLLRPWVPGKTVS